MFELALHRIEAGEHHHDDALGLPVAAHLLDGLLAAVDGLVGECRAERDRPGVVGRRAPLLADVAREPRVLDSAARRLRRIAEAARGPRSPGA